MVKYCTEEKMDKICVVITTYNGEQYIEEQIDSICNQTVKPDRIILIDDNSLDNSFEKSITYLKSSGIPYIAEKNKHNMGYMRAFERALSLTNAKYIAFSDQDDVWKKDKLELLLREMTELEKTATSLPLLIFSDVSVTNERLDVIAPSFNRLQKLNMGKNIRSFPALCAQNVIPGMSMMINDKLKSIALPFPENAIHHDWWIALIAAEKGRIGYVDLPLVLYRQHFDNAIGGNLYDDLIWFNRIRRNLLHPKKIKEYWPDLKYELYENYRPNLVKHAKQKKELIEVIPEKRGFLMKTYLHLCQGGIFSVMWLFVHGVLPPSWQRKIFFCIALLKKYNKEDLKGFYG